MTDFYDREQEHIPDKPPFATLQWKGTDACMDIHCTCGHHSHLDSYFAYFIECPKCQKVYQCVSYIKLLEVPLEEQMRMPIEAKNPEDIDKEQAELEAIRETMKLGGKVNNEVKSDEKDPSLMRVILQAHPPPAYRLLVLKTSDLVPPGVLIVEDGGELSMCKVANVVGKEDAEVGS